MFNVFHLLQSVIVFGVINHFCAYSLLSLQWDKLPNLNAFALLSVNIYWRQHNATSSPGSLILPPTAASEERARKWEGTRVEWSALCKVAHIIYKRPETTSSPKCKSSWLSSSSNMFYFSYTHLYSSPSTSTLWTHKVSSFLFAR